MLEKNIQFQITIVSMDIEYEIHCNLDSLVVNDGINLNIK